ncbi:MAG: DNA polymerase IV [Chitinophagaceae bacterium]|nr:DNA polymerase IV [Chitinophagaceae bacterium]
MKFQMQFKNYTTPNPNAVILFIDMNSYFASCEQQINPRLRGKPIGVCGGNSNGVIIAPSIEAKACGVKTGMRFNEAKSICPDIVAVNPKSSVYRQFHKEIMQVLRKYSDDVIPKSIDEAVVNLTEYRYIYPRPEDLALKIKADIRQDVGDWLRCSIGIAPNTFLAKLATDLQKPDGLVRITPENIDTILATLELIDLPGIGDRWAIRLKKAGIRTPLELRYAPASVLKKIMGVLGYYWSYRLHFAEVDFYTNGYKSMSAVRTLSGSQRNNPQVLQEIFLSLCMKLESRLVQHHVFCRQINFMCSYQNHSEWHVPIRFQQPLQDGTDMYHHLYERIQLEQTKQGFPIFHNDLRTIGVAAHDFITDQNIQYELFDDKIRKDTLRKTVYGIKESYGREKIIKAVELREEQVVSDIIGFGSVKDMYEH